MTKSVAAKGSHICSLLAKAADADVGIPCLSEDMLALAGIASHGKDETFFRRAVHETTAQMMTQR